MKIHVTVKVTCEVTCEIHVRLIVIISLLSYNVQIAKSIFLDGSKIWLKNL